MNDLIDLLWIIPAVLIVLAGILWIAVPLCTGLPWVPTRDIRIRKALQLAELLPGELLYDLGSGDGRVLVIAAREFSARAVGIEISPMHCLIALIRARLSGLHHLIHVRCGSFYSENFADADVVFVYVTPEHASRLRPIVERQLKDGARIVTISAELEGWQPEKIDRDDLVFLYRIPPTSGSVLTYLSQNLKD